MYFYGQENWKVSVDGWLLSWTKDGWKKLIKLTEEQKEELRMICFINGYGK